MLAGSPLEKDYAAVVPPLVNVPRPWRRVKAAAIALIALAWLGSLSFLAWHHSPHAGELPHLFGGLCFWQLRRYDIYAVNPPLGRAIASGAAAAAGMELPQLDQPLPPGWIVRSEWIGNRELLDQNPDWRVPLFWARVALLPFALLGLRCCYLWGKEAAGRRIRRVGSPPALAYVSDLDPYRPPRRRDRLSGRGGELCLLAMAVVRRMAGPGARRPWDHTCLPDQVQRPTHPARLAHRYRAARGRTRWPTSTQAARLRSGCPERGNRVTDQQLLRVPG